MNSLKRSTYHSTYHEWLIGGALLAVLALTRSGHFGSSIRLPDASWAMFWLSGAFALRWWWPAIMMVAAAAIDYFAISNGVSNYCLTPAYPFLIPAYLSLWFTGHWVTNSSDGQMPSLLRMVVSILNGVTLAFIISNTGFFLFAGYFSAMPAWDYALAIARYWPGYLLHTGMYVSTGLLIHYIINAVRSNATTQSTSS